MDVGYHALLNQVTGVHVAADHCMTEGQCQRASEMSAHVWRVDDPADRDNFRSLNLKTFTTPEPFEFQPHHADDVCTVVACYCPPKTKAFLRTFYATVRHVNPLDPHQLPLLCTIVGQKLLWKELFLPSFKLKWAAFEFFAPSPLVRVRSWLYPFRAIVNKKQCETRGLFMSLVIHYWIGDVQDSQGVSIFQNANYKYF